MMVYTYNHAIGSEVWVFDYQNFKMVYIYKYCFHVTIQNHLCMAGLINHQEFSFTIDYDSNPSTMQKVSI